MSFNVELFVGERKDTEVQPRPKPGPSECQSEALSDWSSGIKAEDGWCWTQFDSQVGSLCCRLYSINGEHRSTHLY